MILHSTGTTTHSNSNIKCTQSLPLLLLLLYQPFACTLLEIWQVHWQLVFNSTFFNDNIVAQILKLLTTLMKSTQIITSFSFLYVFLFP
ncbi:hypothetical protein BDB01DRAFT_786144 [Pilobolus umbonatus]|nr:hypothetical protein BDB01DRAFT_786144 [Pilobolus umbonatus]